jgi:hypothetical protein
VPEEKPPENVLKDKLLLKDWEQTKVNENFSWIYDRRAIDQEVYKKYQNQGDEMKAALSHQELTHNVEFWKSEEIIRQESLKFMKELKNTKFYDPFYIKPEPYDMKAADNAQPEKNKKVKAEDSDSEEEAQKA